MTPRNATATLALSFALTLAGALHAGGQTLDWIRQDGDTIVEPGRDVAGDGAGGAYTVGRFGDGFSASDSDAFLRRYGDAGELQWTRTLAIPFTFDVFESVVADPHGNAIVAGISRGAAFGANRGDDDLILAKYASDGELIWGKQLGTTEHDQPRNVAIDVLGNIYVSGDTQGSFGGPSNGSNDVFLSKFDGAGNLYVSVAGAVDPSGNPVRFGKVIVFDPAGAEIGVYGETSDAGLLTPNDLAFDNQGNLYISERGRVELFAATTGAYLGVFGETTNLSLNPGGGLAFDGEGNLYVADFFLARHYDSDGRALGVYGDTATVGLSRAVNLVFAPVPEPHTFAFALAGLSILTCHGRGRRWQEPPWRYPRSR